MQRKVSITEESDEKTPWVDNGQFRDDKNSREAPVKSCDGNADNKVRAANKTHRNQDFQSSLSNYTKK